MVTKSTNNAKKTKKPAKSKDDHLEDVEKYWTKRSRNFSDGIEKSIADGSYLFWLNNILKEVEPGKKLKVLDCGCGPGFFSIILGREGHFITAVDYSAGMVEMAKKNFKKYGVIGTALKMDAQNLEFEDDTFDLIVSRNMMWTLADPEKVYSEWMRVLRPGGKLICFDGNYKLYNHDDDYAALWKKDEDAGKHKYMTSPDLGPSEEQFKLMDQITNQDFVVCYHRRPHWDIEILIKLGATRISTEVEGIHGAYVEKDGVREYLPMVFKVVASKADANKPFRFLPS